MAQLNDNAHPNMCGTPERPQNADLSICTQIGANGLINIDISPRLTRLRGARRACRCLGIFRC
jgi:hypothetical protein